MFLEYHGLTEKCALKVLNYYYYYCSFAMALPHYSFHCARYAVMLYIVAAMFFNMAAEYGRGTLLKCCVAAGWFKNCPIMSYF